MTTTRHDDGSGLWRAENIAGFNFTFAMPGGAWLETKEFPSTDGPKVERNWFSADHIDEILGAGAFTSLCKKQGWMTGCQIQFDPFNIFGQ